MVTLMNNHVINRLNRYKIKLFFVGQHNLFYCVKDRAHLNVYPQLIYSNILSVNINIIFH